MEENKSLDDSVKLPGTQWDVEPNENSPPPNYDRVKEFRDQDIKIQLDLERLRNKARLYDMRNAYNDDILGDEKFLSRRYFEDLKKYSPKKRPYPFYYRSRIADILNNSKPIYDVESDMNSYKRYSNYSRMPSSVLFDRTERDIDKLESKEKTVIEQNKNTVNNKVFKNSYM
jgi:hypothetical protein